MSIYTQNKKKPATSIRFEYVQNQAGSVEPQPIRKPETTLG